MKSANSKELDFTKKQVVIFVREQGFYTAEYPSGYDDWATDARNNPGTIRIEDQFGDILWEAPRNQN
jgi:hypothetical protein